MQKKTMAGLFLLVLLGAFLLSAASAGSPLEAHEIQSPVKIETPSNVLLFEGDGDTLWLAGTDLFAQSLLLCRIDTAGGSVQTTETGPANFVFLQGGDIYLDGSSGLECYDSAALERRPEADLSTPWSPSFADSLALDSEGTVYAVLGSTLKVIKDGAEQSSTEYGNIQFLAVDEHDRLIFWENRKLHVGEQSFDCTEVPEKLLPGGLLVDSTGRVSKITDTEVTAFFQSENFAAQSVCSGDGYGGLLAADGSTVCRYAADGAQLGSVQLTGTPLALCPFGAVTLDGDRLCWTAFGSAFASPSPAPTADPEPSFSPALSEEPDETPSPEPEETPSPEPTEDPWADDPPLVYEPQYGYILMQPGSTAAELREIYAAGTLEIRDTKGGLVEQGRLATGMTVSNRAEEDTDAYVWTLVILGDCSGSGTVYGSDVALALEYCLTGYDPADPYARAADLNNDGRITTEDTELLSALVED